MAVYERRFRGYEGVRTAAWSRFLVIPRYAFREVFKSRMFTGFFTLCMVPFLLGLGIIYVQHNLKALSALAIDPSALLPINATAFDYFLRLQALFFGFVLVLVAGPGLMSADLRNNALPLYLARPFSRSEYVLGKFTVLAALLSAITWIPGLLLFALAAYFKGWTWLSANLNVAIALFVGSWLWIAFLSLLCLALSAWVKWKPLASGLLVGIVMIAAVFGKVVNQLLDTRWGALLDARLLIRSVWAELFGVSFKGALPVGAATLTLALATGFSLFLLSRRLRAYEIVS